MEMEMGRDTSNSNQHDPHSENGSSNSKQVHSISMFGNSISLPPSTPSAFRGSHHRRAHSEVSFRIPEDMDFSSDPFNGSSTEDIGSEDDLFTTYIDIDKLGSASASGSDLLPSQILEGDKIRSDQSGNGNPGGDINQNPNCRPRHRHSNSVDASSAGSGGTGNTAFGEIMEAKKAMPPDKLAELWSIDPKRAKRILANRQSAARSKERKARYMQELERKVHTLQTEATTLSAQLTLYQRDTNGLTTENTELKLRLQAMEQQAQLRDALNEALKHEVERLRVATGETMNPSDSFNLGMNSMPYNTTDNNGGSGGNNHSSFYMLPQRSRPQEAHQQQDINMPHHFNQYSDWQHRSQQNDFFQQNDPIGRLQGLDIGSNRGGPVTASGSLPIVKLEGPSMSASESSSNC